MPITTAGRNFIASLITGTGTLYNTANAHLAVGNGTTAFDAAHTDLQGASRFRRICTTASAATNVLTFVTTYATAEANFAWQEWGVFNHATAGTMLTRRVENLGTKVSGSWTFTVTITINI